MLIRSPGSPRGNIGQKGAWCGTIVRVNSRWTVTSVMSPLDMPLPTESKCMHHLYIHHRSLYVPLSRGLRCAHRTSPSER
jgi:hypothetical protein